MPEKLAQISESFFLCLSSLQKNAGFLNMHTHTVMTCLIFFFTTEP